MPKKKSLRTLNCSLAQALDVVGDGWTLLALRDLFLGASRFEHLVQSLGIARNVLTDRLTVLVREGLVLREGTQARPLYRLSEKGFAAVPALVGLMQWGDRYYAPGGAPIRIVDGEGRDVTAICTTEADGRRMAPEHIFAEAGPGAKPPTRAYVAAMGASRRRRKDG